MKRTLFISFLFLLSGVLFSQKDSIEIKGKVLSSKRKIVYRAEIYLKVNDSVYKTTTDTKGEFRFLVKKSGTIASLYSHSTNQTVCNDVKKSSFLYNPMTYKVDLTKKPDYSYDFELKNVNIDYSTPSILFGENLSNVVLDVKYGKTSANINEVVEYFVQLTKRYPKMVLDLEGMVSDNEKGKDLGLARAKYVASLFIAKGVPAINLKTQSRGINLPEITNSEIVREKSKSKAEQMRSMNRRVVIKILKPGEDIPDKEGNHF